MNTEEDEFRRIEREAKRRAQAAEDDDTQVYVKPWVGLTDDERRGLREWQKIQKKLGPVWAPMMLYLYEAIEAKLKEKNT